MKPYEKEVQDIIAAFDDLRAMADQDPKLAVAVKKAEGALSIMLKLAATALEAMGERGISHHN
jgi:hypothetical protein